jgi:hypothetical protein
VARAKKVFALRKNIVDVTFIADPELDEAARHIARQASRRVRCAAIARSDSSRASAARDRAS